MVINRFIPARNGSYRPVGSSDLFRELSVPLIKHPGMSLRLVYQDPMGNYFHSLMTTAPLTGAIGFIIVMLFPGGTLVTTATCRARIAGNPGYSYLKR